MKTISILLKEEYGTTAIEYSLLLALVAMAIIGAVTFTGEQLSATFGAVITSLSGA